MKKSYLVSLIGLLVAFIMLAAIKNLEPSPSSQKELMDKLGYTNSLISDTLKNRTYLGQDNSQIEAIILQLPEQSYRKLKDFTISENQTLNLNYVLSDNYSRGGNGLDTFPESVKENNTLLLFSAIKGLKTVNILFYENESQTTLNRTDTYNLDTLTNRFGKVDPQTIDAQELYRLLSENLQLSEFYFSHYSRLFLGSETKLVAYRLGEPSQVLERDDGSTIWQYEELKQSFYFDKQSKLSASSTPEYAGQSYEELVAYLGQPSVSKKLAEGSQYMAYSLREDKSHFAYFILQNNVVTASGVTIDEDFTYLQ